MTNIFLIFLFMAGIINILILIGAGVTVVLFLVGIVKAALSTGEENEDGQG